MKEINIKCMYFNFIIIYENVKCQNKKESFSHTKNQAEN